MFSRRTAQTAPEKGLNSTTDDSDAYLSGISHLSSIFEDGFENLCGLDERDMMQSDVNCEYLQRNSDQFSGTKLRSLASNGEKGNISDGNEENVNCSKYLRGESLVVVSNGKYFLGGSSDFKPLNLPVRSLRSRVVENDKPESKMSRDDSTFEIEEAKGKNAVKVLKIRGVVPMNLEKKLEEASGPSSLPWRSRSGRMETGEETSNHKPHMHYRPHSVGEFEFEHLKSRSLQGSQFSSSPELASSGVENVEGEKVFPVKNGAPVIAEAPLGGAKTRAYSVGGYSEMNKLENLENSCGNYYEEDKIGKGKQAYESSDSDTKPPALAKALSRAKSVRTIKSSRYAVSRKEQCSSKINGKLESDTLAKRGRGEGDENPRVKYHQNQEHDRSFFTKPKPKPTLFEFHDEGKEDVDGNHNARGSEEETGSHSGKSSREDNDDARNRNIDNEAELEGSEVDRKAGEFIAKFREQIRLQKNSSAEGNSGW